MRINFEVIKNEEQRYPTVGDYYEKDGVMEFRVSDMSNEDYHFLVFLHELIEQHLTKKRGITEEQITAFDIQFEKERELGAHTPDEEPGYAPNAPYKNEHFIAEAIERIMANQLGVDWEKYNKTVMEL